MISTCEGVRLQQLRKGKYLTLASILHNLKKKKNLTEPHIYLHNTLSKSHGFLISCFETGNIFQ